jgi:hypothetical protein
MMRHAVIIAMLALAGCDRVYGLTGRGDKPVDRDDGGVNADAPNDASGACPVHPNPVADDDNDGIPNQSDLCPEDEDRGNNEDGDCFADACDLCPHLVGDFVDADGDLIGDDCDFNNASGTFDVRIFEGFDHADELHLFDFEIDHATAQLVKDSSGPTAFGFSNEPVPTTFQIETRFVIPTDSGSWRAGLIFGATSPVAAPNGWAVTISRMTASELRLEFFQVSGGSFVAQGQDRILIATGPVRLGVRVEGRDIAITTSSGVLTNTELISFPNTLSGGLQQPSYWGVTTGSTLVAFDYMTGLHH